MQKHEWGVREIPVTITPKAVDGREFAPYRLKFEVNTMPPRPWISYGRTKERGKWYYCICIRASDEDMNKTIGSKKLHGDLKYITVSRNSVPIKYRIARVNSDAKTFMPRYTPEKFIERSKVYKFESETLVDNTPWTVYYKTDILVGNNYYVHYINFEDNGGLKHYFNAIGAGLPLLDETKIYLSKNGNDHNTGLSKNVPVKTLRQAIAHCRDSSKEYTITLMTDIKYEKGIDCVAIGGKKITIKSDGDKKKIDANQCGRVLEVRGGSTVILENLILTGGKVKFGAGILINESPGSAASTVTIKNTEIIDNTANTSGGGVRIGNNAKFIMESGLIKGNKANTGGAVNTYRGPFIMKGGRIEGNTATTGGAAVFGSEQITISGSAKIAENNDVYLQGDNKLKIEGQLTPEGGGVAAYISFGKKAGYTARVGKKVLDGDFGNDNNYTKIKVKSPSDGPSENYYINNEGKLKKDD